jgi:hypothetical protein
MFPINIVTDKRRFETTADKVFHVLTPEQKQAYLDENVLLNERTYHLLIGHDVYEIICPEIHDRKNSANKYLIIPEFLIPGRPYPIYVYIYGIVLYSSNPKMGQREAAEKTRIHFDLKTFSHTTLGRAMKKLEVLIKTNDNKSEMDNETKDSGRPVTKCFPSVELTVKRKNTVLSYLKEASGQDSQLIQESSQPQMPLNFKRHPYKGAFIDICHRIVEYSYKKYHRLLL